MNIQNAIDAIIASVPGAPFPDTVDTVKVGDASQPLTGVAVCFLATAEVVEKTAHLGANLIITHEPIFYNHLDATDWLFGNPGYQAKRDRIEKSGIVIWRFHDYLHSLQPDSTLMGLLHSLDWQAYALPEQPFLCSIPPMTLLALAQWVKGRLGLSAVQVVGDFDLTCRTVGLLPGFPPAEMQIGVLGLPDVDALIAGEIHEWETSEYVRDAVHLGFNKGLVVTGHLASEEPGMKWIIPWLQERLPGIPIHFVPTGTAFHHV